MRDGSSRSHPWSSAKPDPAQPVPAAAIVRRQREEQARGPGIIAHRYEDFVLAGRDTRRQRESALTVHLRSGVGRADGKVPAGLGLPDDVVNKATQDKNRFLKENDWVAVPAGRYAWDKELKPIYLASLWLSRPLERTDEAAFKTALA